MFHLLHMAADLAAWWMLVATVTVAAWAVALTPRRRSGGN